MRQLATNEKRIFQHWAKSEITNNAIHMPNWLNRRWAYTIENVLSCFWVNKSQFDDVQYVFYIREYSMRFFETSNFFLSLSLLWNYDYDMIQVFLFRALERNTFDISRCHNNISKERKKQFRNFNPYKELTRST